MPARVPKTGGCCGSWPSASRAWASYSRAASQADLVPLGEGDGEVGLRPLQAADCASPGAPARGSGGAAGAAHGSDGR